MSFARAATLISKWAGTKWAFFLAVFVVAVWASFGPYYQWSDGHQLLINTGTTIVTFWMVFIIQNSQNRDMAALQVKLDEILRAIPEARSTIVAVDVDSDEDEIQALREEVRDASL
jgi:low affinity Fe/Cu permease